MPKFKANTNVIEEFEGYWNDRKSEAFNKLCEEEKLTPQKFESIIQTYVFANRLPRHQEIVDSLNFQPKILDRKNLLERVADRIENYIVTFIDGMGGIT